MRKKWLACITATALSAVFLAGCDGNKTVLAEAGEAEYLSYTEPTRRS